MKYCKKPIVIDAEQFLFVDGERGVKTIALANKLGMCWRDNTRSILSSGHWIVKTLEGDMIVSDGDWIIIGIKGEKYPCKSDIFEMTYEKVKGK